MADIWMPTAELRFAVKDILIAGPPFALEQRWHNQDTGQSEWRQVPYVTIPAKEFDGRYYPDEDVA